MFDKFGSLKKVNNDSIQKSIFCIEFVLIQDDKRQVIGSTHTFEIRFV